MKQPVVMQRTVKSSELPGDLHPVLKRIYASRGIRYELELAIGLDSLLPFELLKGIDDATSLLYKALKEQRRILIVGDYDADGATSTALLMRSLQRFGFENLDYLLPNRFEYGYGLSPEIVAVARLRNPHFIITVDNGIASVDGVAEAKASGIGVLITDHHLPGKVLPDANVIVNPNQPGDTFPSKALAGVGVVFYLMLAFRSYLRNVGWFESQGVTEPNLAEYLDIVALGTVADVVPLDHNNRILVEQGLRRMRAGQCQPGIQSLINVARRDRAHLRASDLGFAIAPRLNAAGRLDDMSVGVECLLTDDFDIATQLAMKLDDMNQQRRQISDDMHDEADQMLSDLHLSDEDVPTVYCLYQRHWHQGVTGILAGRIKDRLHRPTIVFAKGESGELKGSGRSISGFHIRDALDTVASKHTGLISKFGGHAMAAGLTLAEKNLSVFISAINEYADDVLNKDQLEETILTDGPLHADELDYELARLVEQAGPWGQGCPPPRFEGRFNVIHRRRIGVDQRHLKLVLETEGVELDAVAFSFSDEMWPEDKRTVDLVYRLEINRFRGNEALQLMIEHVML